MRNRDSRTADPSEDRSRDINFNLLPTANVEQSHAPPNNHQPLKLPTSVQTRRRAEVGVGLRATFPCRPHAHSSSILARTNKVRCDGQMPKEIAKNDLCGWAVQSTLYTARTSQGDCPAGSPRHACLKHPDQYTRARCGLRHSTTNNVKCKGQRSESTSLLLREAHLNFL